MSKTRRRSRQKKLAYLQLVDASRVQNFPLVRVGIDGHVVVEVFVRLREEVVRVQKVGDGRANGGDDEGES